MSERKSAYGPEITLLQERVQSLLNMEFASKGRRAEVGEYSRWLHREVFEPFSEYTQRLNHIFDKTNWNDVENARTVAGWTGVQEICHDAIDRAIKGHLVVPPILLLAIHRQSIRAVTRAARALAEFVGCFVAPDPGAAIARAKEFESYMLAAGILLSDVAELIGNLTPVAARRIPLASVSGVALGSVIEVFPELSSVARADPAMLRPVEKLQLMARVGQDRHRREERFSEAANILESASISNPNWIEDGALFVDSFSAAWSQLNSQSARILGEFEGANSLVRVDGVLDALSKIAEGPFRRLGSLLVVAGKVAAGTAPSLNSETLFQNRRLSGVHRDLTGSAPTITSSVDRTLRNAEAHYDYEVLADTVKIRHLPPHARSPADAIVEELFHDDILEQALDILEATCAMSFALMAFVWRYPNVATRERFRATWLSLHRI
ncbi:MULTISPECIES: hypothetical protein [Micromonospora]|uniref:hypothetical protein n=1 Tax=Micromonospora TaxID=1873 RepID=UPI00207C82E0|nr:hypothetical protein [Micromonospora sp. CPM1]MCO1613605.1 hypothetical protein [Micromonospora sp. CPM1]